MRRGSHFYRQVAVLAAPIVIQNLITSALGMADTFMVGLLGELPMAAVTLANIPLFVLQLFIFGVQSGASILISQYWGRKDMAAINRVMGVAMWIVFLVSSVFAWILFFFPSQFLGLFGNQPEVIALAARYGRIAGLSCVFDSLVMIYVATYRSMERPKLGMYILVVSMLVNTFLNWVLIFGKLGAPALGVEGAALATLIARILELTGFDRCMVFCNTKGATERITKFLQLEGIEAECIHGDIPQKRREQVMDRFRQGKLRVFVSTDVAARGIDVDDVDIVFNCDVPDENQDYVHRIGRTGRARRQGVAVSLIADYPAKMRIDDIASKTRNQIVPVKFDADGNLAVIE